MYFCALALMNSLRVRMPVQLVALENSRNRSRFRSSAVEMVRGISSKRNEMGNETQKQMKPRNMRDHVLEFIWKPTGVEYSAPASNLSRAADGLSCIVHGQTDDAIPKPQSLASSHQLGLSAGAPYRYSQGGVL